MKSAFNNKRGQAIVEMALFGSLILLIFGYGLSYMQRLNDQQYVQMEAFRRTLEKACTYRGATSGGAGASAQMTLLENRRYADVSESYRKGSASSVSASSSVYWAVPKQGEQSEDIVFLRVNDDENSISKDATVDNITSSSETTFDETNTKEETRAKIVNTRESNLKDKVTTKFLDKDKSVVWQVTQGVYKDTNGQYRYDAGHVNTTIHRGREWETRF